MQCPHDEKWMTRHDAAVAARALRDAAKGTLYGHDAVGLRRRADWVESEGGASDG